MPSRVDGLAYVAIGTADLARSLALYRDAMSGEVVADEMAAGDEAQRFYGLPAGTAARRVTVAHGPGRYGMVQLLDFGSAAGGRVLDGGVPTDHGHSKTLDVFVDDYEAAERLLHEAGFRWETDPREYDGGGITATEGHVHAPDDVLLAILKIGGAPRSTFAQGTGLFSEVGASSQIVDDLEENVRFYREGFGFMVHYDQELGGAEVDSLVGLPEGSGMRLTIVAPEGLNTGKIGLIRYGHGTGRSLAQQARPPRIGIIAHGFVVDGLDELLPRLEALGGQVEVPPVELRLGPWGPVRAAALASPGGVRLELLEPQSARRGDG